MSRSISKGGFNKIGKALQHLSNTHTCHTLVEVVADLHTKESILREALLHKLRERNKLIKGWQLVQKNVDGAEAAAVRLQTILRARQARKKLQAKIHERDAAQVLQAVTQGALTQKRALDEQSVTPAAIESNGTGKGRVQLPPLQPLGSGAPRYSGPTMAVAGLRRPGPGPGPGPPGAL